MLMNLMRLTAIELIKSIHSFFRDMEKIRTGLGEDVSHFLTLVFSFVISVIIAFIYGWQLTLIVISYLPIVFVTNIFVGRVSFQS